LHGATPVHGVDLIDVGEIEREAALDLRERL
jgi:hypothetical protein